VSCGVDDFEEVDVYPWWEGVWRKIQEYIFNPSISILLDTKV
jgi:hypothetical protein